MIIHVDNVKRIKDILPLITSEIEKEVITNGKFELIIFGTDDKRYQQAEKISKKEFFEILSAYNTDERTYKTYAAYNIKATDRFDLFYIDGVLHQIIEGETE